ncbi:ABC transporter permease, partial [Streptomyces sp. WAC07061]
MSAVEETRVEETLVRETAPGYRAGRTLPLRVEALRQWRRRRTMVMGGVLAALPFVMIIAFAVGGGPDGGRG